MHHNLVNFYAIQRSKNKIIYDPIVLNRVTCKGYFVTFSYLPASGVPLVSPCSLSHRIELAHSLCPLPACMLMQCNARGLRLKSRRIHNVFTGTTYSFCTSGYSPVSIIYDHESPSFKILKLPLSNEERWFSFAWFMWRREADWDRTFITSHWQDEELIVSNIMRLCRVAIWKGQINVRNSIKNNKLHSKAVYMCVLDP